MVVGKTFWVEGKRLLVLHHFLLQELGICSTRCATLWLCQPGNANGGSLYDRRRQCGVVH